MKATRCGAILLFLALACVAFVPLTPVLAQGIEGPLVDRVAEKADAATSDPVAFVGQQTTEEVIANDIEWTLGYGCYLVHTGGEETGIPPPDLEECDGFEDAIGISEEEAEEVTAAADELEDAVAVEAQAIAEDLEDSLGRILDDPLSAPEEGLGFVQRTLAALGRIIDAVIGTVGGAIDRITSGLGEGLGILWKGTGIAVAAPLVAVSWLASGAASAVTAMVDATLSGLTALVTGFAAAASASATTLEGAKDAIATGIDEALTKVRDTVSGLFGGADDAVQTKPAGDLTDDLSGRGDGITDPLDRLVGEAGRALR